MLCVHDRSCACMHMLVRSGDPKLLSEARAGAGAAYSHKSFEGVYRCVAVLCCAL